MYDGYVESEEKVEARKQRILGIVAPTETPPPQNKGKQRSQVLTAKEVLKRQFLIVVVLHGLLVAARLHPEAGRA